MPPRRRRPRPPVYEKKLTMQELMILLSQEGAVVYHWR